MADVVQVKVADLQECMDSRRHGVLEWVWLEQLALLAEQTDRGTVLMRLDFPKSGPVAVEFRAKRAGVWSRWLWWLAPGALELWRRR